MASVRKLRPEDPNSPWVCEYTDGGGARRRHTPKTGLKKDADAFRRRIEGELERGEHVAKSQTITVSEGIDRWLRHCDRRVRAQDGLRERTLRSYTCNIETHIRPTIGARRLTDITLRVLQKWVEDLAFDPKRPRSVHTLTNSVMILGQVLKFAVVEGHVGKNVLEGREIRIPGRLSAKREIPTKAVMRDCLAIANAKMQGGLAPWCRPCLLIAVYGGLRMGEIRALRWEHVDLVSNTIRVRVAADDRGAIGPPKTAYGVRDVPIAPPLRGALVEWRDQNNGWRSSDLVLRNHYGRMVQPGVMLQSWRAVQHRAIHGKPIGRCRDKHRPGVFRFHDLRHFAASLFIETGLPPKRIQEIMGHHSITMTFDLYGHLFDDEKMIAAAMDKMGRDLLAA